MIARRWLGTAQARLATTAYAGLLANTALAVRSNRESFTLLPLLAALAAPSPSAAWALPGVIKAAGEGRMEGAHRSAQLGAFTRPEAATVQARPPESRLTTDIATKDIEGAFMRMVGLALSAVACAAFLSPATGRLWYEPFATLGGSWQHGLAGLDFKVFYAAADRILHGQAEAMYTPSALAEVQRNSGAAQAGGAVLPYLNPPFFALLLTPLAALPFGAAYIVWTALNLVLVAALAWLVWDSTERLATPGRLSLVIATTTALPIAMTLQLGQFSLLLGVSWMLAYRLLRSGHEWRAGLALALLLIKPELLLPVAVVLIWQRRTKALRALSTVAVVAAVVSLVMIGWGGAARYPVYLYENATQHLPGTETGMMFGWNAILRSHVLGPGDVVLTVAMAVVTVYLTVRCCKGLMAPSGASPATAWLVITMATLLIDPHLYFEDLTLLVPVACVYVAESPAGQRGRATIFLAAGWSILALGLAPNLSWGFNLFGVFLAGSFVLLVARLLFDGRGRAAVHVRGDLLHLASPQATERSPAA